ncbi:MAG: hypothetical protein ACRD0F_05845, partial [Acidimicrobiales bacterium]
MFSAAATAHLNWLWSRIRIAIEPGDAERLQAAAREAPAGPPAHRRPARAHPSGGAVAGAAA